MSKQTIQIVDNPNKRHAIKKIELTSEISGVVILMGLEII